MGHLTVFVSEIELTSYAFEGDENGCLYDRNGHELILYPERLLMRGVYEEALVRYFQGEYVVVTDNDYLINLARTLVAERSDFSMEVIEWLPSWSLVHYPVNKDGTWAEGMPSLHNNELRAIQRLLKAQKNYR